MMKNLGMLKLLCKNSRGRLEASEELTNILKDEITTLTSFVRNDTAQKIATSASFVCDFINTTIYRGEKRKNTTTSCLSLYPTINCGVNEKGELVRIKRFS